MSRPICTCVGAVVKNNGRHYLVLYRLKYPHGLAFPAGHISPGESPDEALKRELLEETGIRVKSMRAILWGATISNRCSRGVRKHRWYVYRVLKYSGRPKRREKKNHAFVKFMTLQRIRDYLRRNDVDPAWVQIFKKLNIRGLI